MIDDATGARLHDRSTRGDTLTYAEREDLATWYEQGDRREAAQLGLPVGREVIESVAFDVGGGNPPSRLIVNRHLRPRGFTLYHFSNGVWMYVDPQDQYAVTLFPDGKKCPARPNDTPEAREIARGTGYPDDLFGHLVAHELVHNLVPLLGAGNLNPFEVAPDWSPTLRAVATGRVRNDEPLPEFVLGDERNVFALQHFVAGRIKSDDPVLAGLAARCDLFAVRDAVLALLVRKPVQEEKP